VKLTDSLPPYMQAADVMRMFHGTAMTNVSSIVRQGLVVPSAEKGVHVVNGR
jgi:RNA:NAD 2'-phosphotransferase (TPT1/KptA family)